MYPNDGNTGNGRWNHGRILSRRESLSFRKTVQVIVRRKGGKEAEKTASSAAVGTVRPRPGSRVRTVTAVFSLSPFGALLLPDVSRRFPPIPLHRKPSCFFSVQWNQICFKNCNPQFPPETFSGRIRLKVQLLLHGGIVFTVFYFTVTMCRTFLSVW